MHGEWTVIVVVAGGLLLCYCKRSIHSVIEVNLPVKTHLGVEEVEVLVYVKRLHVLGTCSPVPLIVNALDCVVDVAILQVEISAQSTPNHIIVLPVDVEIGLLAFVAIVLMIGIKSSDIILHPNHLTMVVVAVFVETTAQHTCKALSSVVNREYTATKTTVENLLAHKVRLLYLFAINHKWLKGIFSERTLVLVFLVVAITIGVVQSGIEFPVVVEPVVKEQLEMELLVDVLLVFVETSYNTIMLNLAVGVILAVALEFAAAYAIPSVISVFLTTEGDKLHLSLVIEIGSLSIVGKQ